MAPGVREADGACVVALHPRVERSLAPARLDPLLQALAPREAELGVRVRVGAPAPGPDFGDPLSGPDLGALRAWLDTAARPPRPGVEVVLVPALAAPDTVAARRLGTLRGLALSPWAPHPELGADLGGAHTPTVLLADSELHGRPDAGRVLAHELGHALGLGHDPRPDNLMCPDADGASLDAAQRRTLLSTACPEPRP